MVSDRVPNVDIDIVRNGMRYPKEYVNGEMAEKHHHTPPDAQHRYWLHVKKLRDLSETVIGSTHDMNNKKWIASEREWYKDKLDIKTKMISDPVLLNNQKDILLKNLLDGGVIKPAPYCLRSRRKMRVFTVINSDNTARLISYSPFINRAIFPYKAAKIPDQRAIIITLINEKPEAMAKLDLRKGFYNVKINKKDRQWFTFEWKRKLYWFTRLPMGIADVPLRFQNHVYNVVTLPALREFRKELKEGTGTPRKIGIRNYLDDIIVFGSHEEVAKAINVIRLKGDNAGLQFNEKKSDKQPVTKHTILGTVVDLVEKTISATENQKSKLRLLMSTFPIGSRNVMGLLIFLWSLLSQELLIRFLILLTFRKHVTKNKAIEFFSECYLYLEKIDYKVSHNVWIRNYLFSQDLLASLHKNITYSRYYSRKKLDEINTVWTAKLIVEFLNALHKISDLEPLTKEMNEPCRQDYYKMLISRTIGPIFDQALTEAFEKVSINANINDMNLQILEALKRHTPVYVLSKLFPLRNIIPKEYQNWLNGSIKNIQKATLIVDKTLRSDLSNNLTDDDTSINPNRYRPTIVKWSVVTPVQDRGSIWY